MRNVFLLIVVQALLVTLGFAQTPTPNSDPNQASVKGCLGGSDGNYTVAQDGTTLTFRITSSTVDLKPHVGHDVEVVGQTTNVAPSSGPADNTVIVNAVNMISDHCAAATASTPAIADPAPPTASIPPATDTTVTATASTPAATDPTPTATASTPAVVDPAPAAASTPPATDAAPASTASTPVVADQTPAATATPAQTANAPMAAKASAPAPERTEQLPATASSLPLIGLLGLGLLGTSLLLGRFRTN